MPSKIQIIPADKSGRGCGKLFGSAFFDLITNEDLSSGGWALLQGVLIRRGGDYDARLYFDIGEGFVQSAHIKVPASGRGVINEVIYLPAGIKSMRFSPTAAGGEFELSALSLTKIGAVRGIWRMARRVVAMIYLHPRPKRKVIRLSLLHAIRDLRATYNAANKLRVHACAPDYPGWIALFDKPGADECRRIETHIARFAYHPHFELLLVTEGASQAAVQATLDSLDAQIYRYFTCVVPGASDSGEERKAEGHLSLVDLKPDLQNHVARDHVALWLERFNDSLAASKADEWVMMVRAGDVLAPHALYQFASAARARPGAAVLYSDDDLLDENGQRCAPRFKPDWSLAHLRATNFVGNAVALRGSEVARAGGVTLNCCRHGVYDLLLRVVDVPGDGGDKGVVHIPHVLLHQSAVADTDEQYCLDALRSHLARNGVAAQVSKTLPGCRRVHFQLPDEPPLVSIIVPTRDARELIRQCVESLLEKTTYPRFELLVVDNQSADAGALAYLDEIACYERVRVLRFDHPFNYSAMNNMAVREAKGEVVCLLNNDTEVISPDWLEEMVGHLLQPKAGVVGAKLYFPDGRVQHAGDLVGVGGVAHHAHAFLSRDDPGYCNRAMVAQELSAVTAACLITWRELYLRLGGLNEKKLAVAFNDVDYCLRVREAGCRVVWTPHAELYHHESVSRGKDTTRRKKWRAANEAAYMRKQWKQAMLNDPFYNPNLSYQRPDFSLSHAPVTEQPWKGGR